MAPWGTHHHAGLPPLPSSPVAGFGWPIRGSSVPSTTHCGSRPWVRHQPSCRLGVPPSPPHGAHYRFAKGDRPGNSGEALNGEPELDNWERLRRPLLLPVWPVAARWVSKKIGQHHNFTPASLIIPNHSFLAQKNNPNRIVSFLPQLHNRLSTGIARIFNHNGSNNQYRV